MQFKFWVRAPVGGEYFRAQLTSVFEDLPFTLISPDPEEVDCGDAEAVKAFLDHSTPSLLLNLPYDPDIVDFDKEVRCLKSLAEYCNQKQIPLVHFSNYLVFGETYSSEGYDEYSQADIESNRQTNMLLLESEASRVEQHMIIRLGWLLDGGANCIFDKFVLSMIKGEKVVASDHHYGSPISVNFVIDSLIAIVQQVLCGANNWGVFHLFGADNCSEAEICEHLMRLLKNEFDLSLSEPEIHTLGSKTRAFVGSANLRGQRATDNFGIQKPSWRSGLRLNVEKYLVNQQLIDG